MKRISPLSELGLRAWQQLKDGEAGDGLAAARLADQAEDLALADREIDAVEGFDRAAHAAELQPEVTDQEQVDHLAIA